MRMTVKVLKEAGLEEAMLGLSMNKNQPVDKMIDVADKLAPLDGGHNKFLESICVWLDINAPRYWWQEFDTYRVGMTKQSQSTMHTLLKRPLNQDDFVRDIPEGILHAVNAFIEAGDREYAKSILPESFLQRRVVCTNYKALRHIMAQRRDHRLPEWNDVFVTAMCGLTMPHWIFEKK